MTNITAIILTKNEELNIERCINSIIKLVDRVVVVDSGSNDRTLDLARQLGAEIFEHLPFESHGKQFNWALDNINIQTQWVYRIDADEAVTPELRDEIITACHKHHDDDVNGFIMRHKVYFLGKFLMHGGVYPFLKLNIFKYGKGRYNEREMADHVILSEGTSIYLKNDCLHYDFKDLTSWINKHNWYATCEAKAYINSVASFQNNLPNEAQKAKMIRDNIYYKLPKFLRAKLYYWHRYYFKLGFLDGKAGKIHTYLQAYWYRYLVDAKIIEEEIKLKTLNKRK